MESKFSRITPNNIDQLKSDEIFVFGSNLAGVHGGGAARVAIEKFGAIYGQGVGLQGQSYAIPTMHGPIKTIKPYVDEFISFAQKHPEYKFLVTRIGCGIAGFVDAQIAPLFKRAINVDNIALPQSFWVILHNTKPTMGEKIKNLFSTPNEHKKQTEFMVEAILSAHRPHINNIGTALNLNRFITAQEHDYPIALNEIIQGQKQSHWIWYIFPQMKGLGHSEMSEYYGIVSQSEAEAYWNNEILRERLIKISEALLIHSGKKTVWEIFNTIDAIKVRSCMTLFDIVAPNDIFAEVLHVFFDDKRCEITINNIKQ